MRSSPTFSLYPLRFSFTAIDPLSFPAEGAANILRGAFGNVSRRIACAPDCPGWAGFATRDCPYARECLYARLFEPVADPLGPSGFRDVPRPFVFRAAHLNGRSFRPQDSFHFDLHLFDTRNPACSSAHLRSVFAALGSEGLGPDRARVELLEMSGIEKPRTFDLAQASTPWGAVTVEFRTPTELKSAGRVTDDFAFAVLFRRIRDRISALSSLYGNGVLEIDWRALAERAAGVQLVRHCLRRAEDARRSSRTGDSHPLGGFVGEAAYEGNLAEFVPWLQAAQWTGVGRQTTWGKGEIRVHCFSSET